MPVTRGIPRLGCIYRNNDFDIYGLIDSFERAVGPRIYDSDNVGINDRIEICQYSSTDIRSDVAPQLIL
jgi:hypothetical protein